METTEQALIVTLFRMVRDSRVYQQDVSDLARNLQADYSGTKKLVASLENRGYVETMTFGQKVALTDAGIVVAQRLI